MATARKIVVSTSIKPVFAVGDLNPESAALVSELLQENHDKHHIFFKPSGLHNHTVHHLLSLYALGASPTSMQKQYDEHKKTQRSIGDLDTRTVEAMHDPASFKNFLGNEEQYHNFLEFFRQEIDEQGWQSVVRTYLLKGDDRADDLLSRLYGGFLHPLIHLGFGIEFEQPAIIAEALAQAALHTTYLKPYLLPAEKAARGSGKESSKSLFTLLEEIRSDEDLIDAPHWDDDNKIRDGILQRAPEKMIHYGSQWKVDADNLEKKTAEMINAVVYYSGAAQHPPKQIKFDFYFIHCLNCSIFFSAFLRQSWMDERSKIRLLEWKGRNDLAMYASRKSPRLYLDDIINYQPKHSKHGNTEAWNPIFQRVIDFPEDGHACKLVRAIAHGEQACSSFAGEKDFKIRDGMWTQLGHMAIDSVEAPGSNWVRSAGFDQAWDEFEDRPKSRPLNSSKV